MAERTDARGEARGPDRTAVESVRQAIRAAKGPDAQQGALDLIGRLEGQGRVPAVMAAHFRALVNRRAGRLAAAIENTDAFRHDGRNSLPPFLHRLTTMIETDRYRQAQGELTEALGGWLKTRRLSSASAERVLGLVERFRADAGVDAHWLKVFKRAAARGEKPSEHLPALLHRLQVRKANAQAASQVKILSLGLHCLPWMLPNRWGLRTAEDLLSLDAPFNLAVHDIPTLIRLFGNDFEGYADGANFRIIKSANGKDLPCNRLYKAVFNHHRLRFWTENGFANLVGTLEEKVGNVRRALREPNLVLLIGNVPFDDAQAGRTLLRDLHKAVAARTAEPPLLIGSTQKNLSLQPGTTRIDDRVYHVSLPYPRQTYVWQSDMDADEGLDYESRYVEALLSILREHRLWPEREARAA